MRKVAQYFKSLQQHSRKELVVLIDPDDESDEMERIAELALVHKVETFFVGGSLITQGNTARCIKQLRALGVPRIVLFPGNEMQVVEGADAILFLSLISSRNPEYLIGKHVVAAPSIKQLQLETLATGYMLVESGKLTAANYISYSMPLPHDKPEIAAATALAGEMLGLQHFYLDAGSGAQWAVSESMIQAVRGAVSGTLIVGGGIRTAEAAKKAWVAGADFVVVGNGLFENPDVLRELEQVCKQLNTNSVVVS